MISKCNSFLAQDIINRKHRQPRNSSISTEKENAGAKPAITGDLLENTIKNRAQKPKATNSTETSSVLSNVVSTDRPIKLKTITRQYSADFLKYPSTQSGSKALKSSISLSIKDGQKNQFNSYQLNSKKIKLKLVMQKGKTETDSKDSLKENKTLDIRNRRFEDDFHGMVRHLSSSKKKDADAFVYQLETEPRFDSVGQQQKQIPVSNQQEMEKKHMKKVQSVKQQKLQAYHLIKRSKAGESVR